MSIYIFPLWPISAGPVVPFGLLGMGKQALRLLPALSAAENPILRGLLFYYFILLLLGFP